MSGNNRSKRISELISHEIAKELLRHAEQPLFAKITILEVRVSPDLAVAKVFFSVFTKADAKAAKELLQMFAGNLRHALAKNINLRNTPKLTFIYDESIEHGQQLSNLIDAAIAADAKTKQE